MTINPNFLGYLFRCLAALTAASAVIEAAGNTNSQTLVLALGAAGTAWVNWHKKETP